MSKVIVVGASVSGLATALELLKLDNTADVSLLEKKPLIGWNIICGGAISTFMLRELNITLPQHVIATKINCVRWYSPNQAFWELKTNNIYGYVLWRDRFEAYLENEIRKRGGKIFLRTNVENLTFTNKDTIYVAADGLLGPCRKHLHLKQPAPKDIHIGIQRIARLSIPTSRMDLYFGYHAPKGYCWIIPIGKNVVRIGLGVPLSINQNPSKLLDNFINYVGAEPTGPVRVKLIPTTRPQKKLVYNNVLLTGDAGLLCDPATGGGIGNGYLSGSCAAKAIHENNISNHTKYCSGIIRRNIFRYKLKQVFYELSDQDFNDLIDCVKDFHPQLTRISWAIGKALIRLALKKPKLTVKHKILRKLLSDRSN